MPLPGKKMLEQMLAREAFLVSIEIKLFISVMGLYSLSFISSLLHLFYPRTSLGKVSHSILFIGALIHTAIIIMRTLEGMRPPYQTLYESLSWFAWSAVITYLIVRRWHPRLFTPNTVITLVAVGAMAYALFKRSPAINPLPPALQSSWFIWHVVLAFVSYAVFVVSCAYEAIYLLARPFADRPGALHYGTSEDRIEGINRTAYKLVLFGFPLLAFGIISGAAWADQAWGRPWSWDPKETWSLITFTVFAMYLHAQAIPKWRKWTAPILNLVGFWCMIMTFIGVSWLAKILGIESLHIYTL
jgi:cytochrome c-type biogenesis protein CcsB